MAGAKNPALIFQKKSLLVRDAVSGRTSASATSLSASFGLPAEEIRKILTSMGVRDDG